jgi:hypothetical protein
MPGADLCRMAALATPTFGGACGDLKKVDDLLVRQRPVGAQDNCLPRVPGPVRDNTPVPLDTFQNRAVNVEGAVLKGGPQRLATSIALRCPG